MRAPSAPLQESLIADFARRPVSDGDPGKVSFHVIGNRAKADGLRIRRPARCDFTGGFLPEVADPFTTVWSDFKNP